MSLHIRYILKKASDAALINTLLKSLSLDDVLYFHNVEDNQNWLNEINNEPKSPQAHLKPSQGDLTMDALIKIFPTCIAGKGCVDIGNDRVSEKDMKSLISFTLENSRYFSEITNIQDLIERSNTALDCSSLLNKERELGSSSSQLPAEHPDRRDVFSEGCIAYIKGMNDAETGVLYGNVRRPTYMKASIYINNEDNPLIKDEQGRHILLVPLLPMDENMHIVAIDAYNAAVDMFFQEAPSTFFAKVYPQIQMGNNYSIGAEESLSLLDFCVERLTQMMSIHGFSQRYKQSTKLAVELATNVHFTSGKMASKIGKLMSDNKNLNNVSYNSFYWLMYAISGALANGEEKIFINDKLAPLYA